MLRRKDIFFIKISFVLFFLSLNANAQPDPLEEPWRWVKFTTTSGLPSNIVRSIKDDPDSTPWAMTTDGLAWYDDFQWHTVDTTRHFAGNRFGAIDGFYHNHVLLNIKEGFFLVTKSGLVPFPVDSVSKVMIFNNDTAFVVRKNYLYRYTHGVLTPIALPWWQDILVCGVLTSGHMIFYTSNSVFIWDGEKQIPLLQSGEGRKIICNSCENPSHQGIVIVTFPVAYQGIWEWNYNKPAKHDAFRTVRHAQIATIAENGDAVVVFENNFVRVRRNGIWKTIHLPNFVRDITYARYRENGDLWIATLHGLFLCTLSSQRWTFHNWDESDRRNRVNNILRSNDGTLWLATTGGVVRIQRNGLTISTQSIYGKHISIVTGLVEDHDGNIWISSGSDFTGAYRWDGVHWKYFPIRYHGDDIQVHRIACDSKGRLWFLCMTRGWEPRPEKNPGVFTFENGMMTRWKESDGLPHNRVYSFAEEKNGALWFGTYDGLARWENGRWKIWKRTGGPVAGPVSTLAIDNWNRLWFGMQNQGPGVGMLDSSGTIRYFTTSDGLPDDFIWDIKIDARQRVWVTTQKGLAYFNQKKWLTFDERTGMTETPIWPILPEDSVVQVGTLNNGLATLHRDDVHLVNPRIVIHQPVIEYDHALLRWQAYTNWGSLPPEEILTRFRINNDEWSAWTMEHSFSLDKAGAGDYTLQVQAKGLYGEYDEAGQSISFTIQPPIMKRWYFFVPATVIVIVIFALSLLLYQRKKKYVRELEKSESRYRMITELMSDYAYLYHVREDGSLELIWMTDSFTRLSGYPTQEANSPDFMQRFIHPDDLERAMNEHGKLLQGEQLHLEHRIITRDGKTVWVERRSSPMFDKEGIHVEYIYGVVSDITARKESEQRLRSLAGDLVKTEERERRRMATYLHDVIGQTLTLSYLKLHQWQKKERPQDETLNEIRTMLDQTLRDAHALTFDLCPPIIYELSLGDAFVWLIDRLQKQHDIKIETDFCDEKIFVASELHILLFQAVRELIVNSIKHAEAKFIRFELHRLNGHIKIIVGDDGIGFDSKSMSMKTKDGGGFGLFNIQQRLSDFGARLEINSSPGAGSQIIIEVDTKLHQEQSTPIIRAENKS